MWSTFRKKKSKNKATKQDEYKNKARSSSIDVNSDNEKNPFIEYILQLDKNSSLKQYINDYGSTKYSLSSIFKEIFKSIQKFNADDTKSTNQVDDLTNSIMKLILAVNTIMINEKLEVLEEKKTKDSVNTKKNKLLQQNYDSKTKFYTDNERRTINNDNVWDYDSIRSGPQHVLPNTFDDSMSSYLNKYDVNTERSDDNHLTSLTDIGERKKFSIMQLGNVSDGDDVLSGPQHVPNISGDLKFESFYNNNVNTASIKDNNLTSPTDKGERKTFNAKQLSNVSNDDVLSGPQHVQTTSGDLMFNSFYSYDVNTERSNSTNTDSMGKIDVSVTKQDKCSGHLSPKVEAGERSRATNPGAVAVNGDAVGVSDEEDVNNESDDANANPGAVSSSASMPQDTAVSQMTTTTAHDRECDGGETHEAIPTHYNNVSASTTARQPNSMVDDNNVRPGAIHIAGNRLRGESSLWQSIFGSSYDIDVNNNTNTNDQNLPRRLHNDDEEIGGMQLITATRVDESTTRNIPRAEAISEETMKRRKRKIICFVTILSLVVIGVAITVPLTLSPKPPPPTPSPTSSMMPTSAPSLVPSSNPTYHLLPMIIDKSPESSVAFDDNNSPQSMAVNWLEKQGGFGTDERTVQAFALVTLYYSTNGDGWRNSNNWLSYNTSECDWYGVIVEPSVFGRKTDCNVDAIIGLSLPFNRLNGALPIEISLLSNLKLFDLSQNRRLRGKLHTQIFNRMNKLEQINFGGNLLSGSIPTEVGLLGSTISELTLPSNILEGSLPNEMSNLRKLRQLDLSSNILEGGILDSIDLMKSLERIDFSNNAFSGTIPSTLGLLSNLISFTSYKNLLTGTLSPELGKISKLEYIDVSENDLNGSLPEELRGLTNLVNLKLGRNYFSGTLPSGIGLMSNLVVLDLESNGLTGSISTELGNNILLQNINLYSNSITGSIPSEWGRLQNLVSLNIGDNTVSGTLPSEIGQLQRLETLEIEGRVFAGPKLSGTIPTEFGLTHLVVLNLRNNRLAGSVPSEIGKLSLLESIDLRENFFLNQSIPSEICRLMYLRSIDFAFNSLSGSLPTVISNMTRLEHLNLESNINLKGFPTELGSLQRLGNLTLSHNTLSSSIPTQIGALTNLKNLDLARCNLNGTIPTEIFSLASLQSLSLFGNTLSGKLITEFGALSKLHSLRLEENNLTGKIPEELKSLSLLETLLLTDNDLNGTVPDGICELQNRTQFYFSIDCDEVVCDCCNYCSLVDVDLPTVVNFSLINTTSNKALRTVKDGDVISEAVDGTSLGIRANTEGNVGSVVFAFNGNNNFRTENNGPYSLSGDLDGEYFEWRYNYGIQSVKAVPFTRPHGTGVAGTPLEITFVIIQK